MIIGDETMEKQKKLNDHQLVLMELWREFDRICRKHRIQYMLFAGSALGAIRHGGIIPWDDDLDVVMLRKEYERFLAVAPAELDETRFLLQGEFSDHWPMFFSKMRRKNTACMERYIPKDPMTHQGIYMDIFPCDNLYDNPIMRKMQFLVSKIVIAKSLNLRGYVSDNIAKRLFMAMSSIIPDAALRRFVQYRDGEDSQRVHTFFGGGSCYDKNVFPRSWFQETIAVPFEMETAPVSVYCHEMMTEIYGDYRRFPTERARRDKIHADIVDTEHSYERYLERQRSQYFRDFARSLR